MHRSSAKYVKISMDWRLQSSLRPVAWSLTDFEEPQRFLTIVSNWNGRDGARRCLGIKHSPPCSTGAIVCFQRQNGSVLGGFRSSSAHLTLIRRRTSGSDQAAIPFSLKIY